MGDERCKDWLVFAGVVVGIAWLLLWFRSLPSAHADWLLDQDYEAPGLFWITEEAHGELPLLLFQTRPALYGDCVPREYTFWWYPDNGVMAPPAGVDEKIQSDAVQVFVTRSDGSVESWESDVQWGVDTFYVTETQTTRVQYVRTGFPAGFLDDIKDSVKIEWKIMKPSRYDFLMDSKVVGSLISRMENECQV